MHIETFMKIGADIQAILSFCLRNLRGCNVGSADRGFYEVRRWIDSGGMIYILSP
jgi:hypothetical protein